MSLNKSVLSTTNTLKENLSSRDFFEKKHSDKAIVLKSVLSSNLFVAFVLNLIVFIAMVGVLGIHYEVNDDNAMTEIAYGTKGLASSRLVFINVIIGKLVKTAYFLCPSINWYCIFQLVTIFLSLWMLSWVLLIKNRRFGLLISSYFLACFGFEGYVLMQFTKTAGIASACGAFVFAYALTEKGRQSISKKIIGGALVLAGSLYRFNSCAMTILIFGIVCLVWLADAMRHSKTRKEIFSYILQWTVLGLCILFVKQIDNYAYNSSLEWKYYIQYNTLRSSLLDDGFPDYDSNIELYESLNISREDLTMFMHWDFADPDIFNVESMQKLVDAKESQTFNVQTLACFFTTRIITLVSERTFIIFALFAMLVLFFEPHAFKIVLWDIVLALGIELYIYYLGRTPLHRVDACIWMACMASLAYYFNKTFKVNIRQIAVAMLGCLVLNMNVYIQQYEANRESDTQEYKNELAALAADNSHLYIMRTFNYIFSLAFSPTETIPDGITSNIYSLGGWTTELPTSNYVLQMYGINNPFKDCVDNEKVYIAVYGDVSETEGYIRRHYDANASCVLVNQIGRVNVYSVVSQE